ncbi:MAG: hypothetical protein ABII72_04835 [Parcubacteria group bacterium]
MAQLKKTQSKLTKAEIQKRSNKITKTVRDFKVKLQKLKKRQDKIVEDYTKKLEKMKIEEIKGQLG